MKFRHLWRLARFRSPQRNRIAILHTHDYWIRRLVLQDLPSTTLGLYPERVYLTLTLLIRTLFRIGRVRWRVSDRAGILRYYLREVYLQYVIACLDHIRAEVAISIIDNSDLVQMLSMLDRTRTYIAVQNGTRTLYCVRDSLESPPRSSSIISMTNFFCFGQRDVDLFSQNGHQIESYNPVGSLIAGYYRSNHPEESGTPAYDICLISQWHGHFFGEIIGDNATARLCRSVRAGIDALNLFVRKFAEETGATVIVCMRHDSEPERRYFKTAFGETAVIGRPDQEEFSTYHAVDQSRLVIGLNSTTLADVFPWGRKVLWFNPREDELFQMPEAGISYFAGDDYAAFKSRVSLLLRMSTDEYRECTKERARYINNSDPACPPHVRIREAVLGALKKADRLENSTS